MPYQVVEDVDALITGVSADRNKTAATIKKRLSQKRQPFFIFSFLGGFMHNLAV